MSSVLFRCHQMLSNGGQCFRHVSHTRHMSFKCFNRGFMKKVMTTDHSVDTPTIKSLIKPLVFTVGFSGSVYTACIVWNYENSRHALNHWNEWKQNLYPLQDINKTRKAGPLRNEINEWWNSRTTGFKVFSAIAAINVLVFIGWRIPRLQPLMSKHFTTYTTHKSLKCWPMLWSTFSHYSVTHLVFNLIVLHSFTQIGVNLFGTEQFVSLYLSSGVIASFGSYLAKVVTKRGGASLGASGAILGILSSCCIARPDLQLVIIFLPFFTISAGMALKGIILLDSAGLVFGWRMFDHGAHLAGTLFGIGYTTYSHDITANYKREVVKIWQQIRNKII